MPVPDLFIGVVSHPESSYLINQGGGGFAALLERELTDIGVSSLVSVNVDNSFSDSGKVPTFQQARQGIRAEANLARKWNRYLGRRIGLNGLVEELGQWGKSVWNGFFSPDVKEITRLRNIEESHLRLFLEGLESGASWILILEDDASSPNVKDLSFGIQGIMDAKTVKFANLSHSFTYEELGIRHLLRPSPSVSWAGTTARSILSASRPATNTVCAILYRRQFLQELMLVLRDIPVDPVVPIDWRLNLALMSMWSSKKLQPGECWFVDPAPIIQLSMVRDREGK